MDAGQVDSALSLLMTADKRSPNNPRVLYEMAFAYGLKDNNDSAIAVLRRVVSLPDATDEDWAALANKLDDEDHGSEALLIYDQSIKQFPRSYRLFHERGVCLGRKGRFLDAAFDLQMAITLNPSYAPSYLRSAELHFMRGTNTFWGMYEGEIFMNLEPNTERSLDFGKQLWATYKKNLVLRPDGPLVTFCADEAVSIGNDTISIRRYKKTQHKYTYGTGSYEFPLMYASVGATTLDLPTLVLIREKFLEIYDKIGVDEEYGRNVLVDYQRQIKESGFMEPYSYWLLQRADTAAFQAWLAHNLHEYEEFQEWHKKNPLIITNQNVLLRSQYE